VRGLEHQDVLLGPQRGQVLLVAHDERGDARHVRLGQCGTEQLVDLEVLLAARGHVVGAVEVDRLDLVQVDEVGDVDGLGTARRDLVQLVRLHDHVLALGELVALDDVAGADFLARALVDPPVADPVGGAALQLVEVDRVVLRRREQPDGHGDQPECDHACPDRPCHARPLRPSCRAAGAFTPFHAGTPRAAPRAGRGTQGNGATGGHRTARAKCPNSR
jgi:hypothetical protein